MPHDTSIKYDHTITIVFVQQLKVLPSFPKSCEIVITIQRATDLPSRDQRIHNLLSAVEQESGESETQPADNSSDRDNELLAPFVEVKLQDGVVKTMTMTGPDPLFNEQVQL